MRLFPLPAVVNGLLRAVGLAIIFMTLTAPSLAFAVPPKEPAVAPAPVPKMMSSPTVTATANYPQEAGVCQSPQLAQASSGSYHTVSSTTGTARVRLFQRERQRVGIFRARIRGCG